MADFKYQQIKNLIQLKIDNGDYKYGEKLPSENFLCNKYSISRQSVRKAYDLLEQEGYTYSIRGSGNFVKRKDHGEEKKNIGIILSYANSHMFPNILMGCDSVLLEKGYGMQLAITQNSFELEGKCLDLMTPDKIAGLIVEGTKSALPNPYLNHYRGLMEQGIPVVFVHNHYRGLSTPCIMMDDIVASRKMTKMLIDAGHKKIAGIFKEDDLQGIRRFQGYAEALSEANIRVDDRFIWWFHSNHEMWLKNKYSVSYSLELLRECTAVVCYNDMLAEELYQELSESGVRIPEDISMVGFDNQNVKLDGDQYLTSAQHPRRKMGEVAAKLVCKMIEEGFDVETSDQIIMPTSIITRNSIIKRN